MTEEKKLEPELRFPGFHEPWEEKKLGEISDVRDGTHDTPKYLNSGCKFITSKNLLDNGKIDFEDIVYISKKDFDKINRRSKVDKGDILFGMIGTIGNPVLVKNDDFAIKNIALIKEKDGLKNIYLLYLLSSEYIDRKFHILNTGGTQKFIGLGILRDLDIPIPTLPEQEKIGKFFSTIDKKLDLQRERIEELKSYRKGMMQRIFDQKIRFKDEDGKDYPYWEEKKIRDLGSIYTGKTPSTKEKKFWNGDIPFITPTDISSKYTIKTERYLTQQGAKKSVLIPENSLLITSIASIGKNTINKQVSSCNQQINYIEVNEDNSTEFLYYKISYIKNKLLSFAGQTATKILNKREFEDIDIVIPSLPEQEKIANFLAAIDKRIDLEEEKLELYEDFKKGLMQRMFV